MRMDSVRGRLFLETMDGLPEQEEFDLQKIVADCKDLPVIVRSADFTRVEGRFFDHETYRGLISQSPPEGAEEGWSMRIWQRETALEPWIDKYLICVLVRLPGAQYTIEISADEKRVVYWEWQVA